MRKGNDGGNGDKKEDKLGLSWAKLKFTFVKIVTADEIEVIVEVQYLPEWGRVGGQG